MIIRSKLLAPRVPRGHVPRPRISRRLVEAGEARLLLITAPAGFGKTSLLAELLAKDGVRGAAVSLDTDDADPNRFWAYVGYALHEASGIDSVPLADALLDPGAPPVATAVTAWTNLLLEIDHTSLLVLDDLHEIGEPAVLSSLGRFIEHLPPTLQVVIASRTTPEFPLARWRAAGELLEVNAAELQMSAGEAAQFLRHGTGDRLSPAQVEALTRCTEGWAAGLRLALASLAAGDVDPQDVIDGFDGRRADVADYLAEQVVATLDSPQRAFVEAVCVLDTLTADACAAVAETPDAGARLEALERANLPMVRLDARRGAYRLHRLLRDHLRSGLPPERAAACHRRAGAHFEASGNLGRAFVHAIEAGDTDEATQLLERRSEDEIARSRPLALLHDVRRLGRGLVHLRTPLLLSVAWASFLCSRVTELRAALSELHARRARGELDDGGWAQICNMRSGMARQRGEVQAAIDFAEEGLACAPEPMRPGLLLYRSVAEFIAGQLELSGASAAGCLGLEPEHGPPSFIGITAQSLLAQVRIAQGRLREAQALCEAGVHRLREHAMQDAPMMAVLERSLGKVALERGEWVAARKRFDAAAVLAERGGLSDLMAVIRCLTAHWARLVGDAGTFEAMLVQLEANASRDAWLGRWRDALAARRTQVAEGEVAQMSLEPPGDEDAWLVELHRRDAPAAIELADELRPRAAERVAAWVAVLAIRAERCAEAGRGADADASIREALEAAQEGRIVRGFAEANAKVIDGLLARAIGSAALKPSARSHAAAVRKALAELETMRGQNTDAGVPLPALSARELEVLGLLAEGLTNQQAAARLHVSLATVKTHIHRIFHKLGVRRRTQAVARARELHLV